MTEFRNTLPAIFAKNTYAFSCAASPTMLKMINSFIVDENGDVASFSRFRNKVYGITNDFEVEDLEKEFHTAIHCAQVDGKWNGLKDFDALDYRAMSDKSDCKICKAFDGLTLSIHDPLWEIIYPPNHFGCRCIVLPGYKERISKNLKIADQKAEFILPYFRRNFAKGM